MIDPVTFNTLRQFRAGVYQRFDKRADALRQAHSRLRRTLAGALVTLGNDGLTVARAA